MYDPTSSSQFTSIQDEQTPRQLPPVATQLNPSHSQAAKATSHVDQTLPSSSQTSRDEQQSQLSTTPTSNGTTLPSLPPLSIPPPPSSSSSSSKSPSSLLPKLKTHPADLVSPSHPDGQHSSNVHSPNGSIPFTPIRNSYEDLPSATQADDGGHGFGASFIEDRERDEAGEEREERRLEREERDRRQSVGEGSENGATVGSHEVRGASGNGYDNEEEGENEMEKINGSEVVGEEALVNSSTPPMRVVQLNNDQERHSRSMSTPPPRVVQHLPSQAPSVFSPSSPPAMSPPSNPLPPPASSNPPSRRPSTNHQSQSRPSTTDPTSSNSNSNSNKVSPPTQTRSRKEDEQPPPTSSRSRRVLGEYQMTKTLGAGSMGKVKLGVSGISGEKVHTLSPLSLPLSLLPLPRFN